MRLNGRSIMKNIANFLYSFYISCYDKKQSNQSPAVFEKAWHI